MRNRGFHYDSSSVCPTLPLNPNIQMCVAGTSMPKASDHPTLKPFIAHDASQHLEVHVHSSKSSILAINSLLPANCAQHCSGWFDLPSSTIFSDTAVTITRRSQLLSTNPALLQESACSDLTLLAHIDLRLLIRQ